MNGGEVACINSTRLPKVHLIQHGFIYGGYVGRLRKVANVLFSPKTTRSTHHKRSP